MSDHGFFLPTTEVEPATNRGELSDRLTLSQLHGLQTTYRALVKHAIATTYDALIDRTSTTDADLVVISNPQLVSSEILRRDPRMVSDDTTTVVADARIGHLVFQVAVDNSSPYGPNAQIGLLAGDRWRDLTYEDILRMNLPQVSLKIADDREPSTEGTNRWSTDVTRDDLIQDALDELAWLVNEPVRSHLLHSEISLAFDVEPDGGVDIPGVGYIVHGNLEVFQTVQQLEGAAEFALESMGEIGALQEGARHTQFALNIDQWIASKKSIYQSGALRVGNHFQDVARVGRRISDVDDLLQYIVQQDSQGRFCNGLHSKANM